MSTSVRNPRSSTRSRWVPRKALPCLVGIALLASLALASSARSRQRDAPPGMVLWETATAEAVAPTPELLARGKQLFGIKCATCHGIDGDGNGPAALFLATPPRDFTKGVFKFRTTVQDGMPADMDVFRSITAGFMAHGMPSFRYLSIDERWSLVHYVKSLYPKWERFGEPEHITIPAEPAEQAGAIARGKELYQEQYACAQCHGPSGHGDGDRSGDLMDQWNRPISPRDFTIGASYLKMGWRKRDTVRMLATGIPGTPMPSYLDQLEDPTELGEFWDVARYVEHLIEESRAPR